MLGGRRSIDRSALRAVVFVDREPACMSHCYHHAKAQAAATSQVNHCTVHMLAATCTQELAGGAYVMYAAQLIVLSQSTNARTGLAVHGSNP